MKIILISSFTLLASLSGCAQSGFKNISVPELEKSMQNKIVLVDVRTDAEFKEGHIGDAVQIDWYSSSFMEQMQQFDKATPVYLYCRSGSRSASAAQKLIDSGFKQVYSLQGGILAWQNAQKPIKK
jgi:rhodanese-related sulfurtransferase